MLRTQPLYSNSSFKSLFSCSPPYPQQVLYDLLLLRTQSPQQHFRLLTLFDPRFFLMSSFQLGYFLSVQKSYSIFDLRTIEIVLFFHRLQIVKNQQVRGLVSLKLLLQLFVSVRVVNLIELNHRKVNCIAQQEARAQQFLSACKNSYKPARQPCNQSRLDKLLRRVEVREAKAEADPVEGKDRSIVLRDQIEKPALGHLLIMYQALLTIVSQSQNFRYLEAKPELNKEIHVFVQIRRQELIFLSNENQPMLELSLVRLKSKQNKECVSLMQMVKRSKQDAQRRQNTVVSLRNISNEFKTKLINLLSDRSIRFRSPLAYNPNTILTTSLLSSDSPEQRYRGFLNLAVLLLIALNLRNIIDNIMTYGSRLDFKPISFKGLQIIAAASLIGAGFIVSLIIHKCSQVMLIRPRIIILLYSLNIVLILVGCGLFCNLMKPDSILGMFTSALAMVLSMKIISLAHVSSEIRKIYMKLQELNWENKRIREYFGQNDIGDENLRIINQKGKDMQIGVEQVVFFVFAPTLCFQLYYPRSNLIRWGWLLKRIVQFLIISLLQFVCVMQYILPELEVWMSKYQELSFSTLISQRLLKLAIPNLLFWISGFYTLFHLWLNILSEFMRFGDRAFYGDWWNCTNLEEYWKMWNLPVHFWFIRHVYNPLLKAGFSKELAYSVVFFISALGHQYIVSVPLGLVTYWAFLAMLLQGPLIVLQKLAEKMFRLQKSQIGNVSFWLSFCFLGQPLVVFIYYYLYVKSLN